EGRGQHDLAPSLVDGVPAAGSRQCAFARPDGRPGRSASLQAWFVDRHGNAGPQATRHRRQDAGQLIEVSQMQTLMNQLRNAAVRLSPARAVVVAMLLGPLVGALLAYGAVAAQEPATDEVKIDNFIFNPQELTVAVGTTVKFVNHDDI